VNQIQLAQDTVQYVVSEPSNVFFRIHEITIIHQLRITVQVRHRTVQLVMEKPNYESYAALKAVIALLIFCGCNIIGGEGPGIVRHFKVTTLGFRQSLCVKLPRNIERDFFN